MPRFAISSQTGTVPYLDPEKFLDAVDHALRVGEQFTVRVARSATSVLHGINSALRDHGVALRVLTTSDPEARDCVANMLAGSMIGACAGAGLGAAAWAAVRLLGRTTPLGPFILIASALGGALGASAGVVITCWGIVIRATPDGDAYELTFVPRPKED